MTQKNVNNWTFDVRVRERNLKSGAVTEKDVEKYVAGLPDLAAQSESFGVSQPALAQPSVVEEAITAGHDDEEEDDEEDDIEDEVVAEAAAPEAPAPAPAPVAVAAPAPAPAPAPAAEPEAPAEVAPSTDDGSNEPPAV